MRSNAARNSPQAARRPDGSEDGLAKAIEIVVTPVLFAVAGFGLDRWLDTGPWLAISFGMVAFVVKLLTEWYRYAERMRAHEAELASARPAQSRGLDRAAEIDEPTSLPAGVVLEPADAPTELADEASQDSPLEGQATGVTAEELRIS